MKSKRAFLVEPGRFEIREVELEPVGSQVLIKLCSCGLCNFELNHFEGRMGSFPQVIGHEWNGVVTQLGPDVKRRKVGDMVTMIPTGPDCEVGFSQYAVLDEALCQLAPANVELKYVLGEPLKCIATVLRSAKPEFGDYGVVLGCGPMGQWCVQGLAGNMLAGLIAIDIDDKKLEKAREYGATHTINPQREDAAERIRELTGGHMADFVIEGTGIPAILNQAQDYLRQGKGRLVLMSSHSKEAAFDFRKAVAQSTVIISAHRLSSVDEQDDLRRALKMLGRGVFKVSEMVTHEFALCDIQEAFQTLKNKPEGYNKGIVLCF